MKFGDHLTLTITDIDEKGRGSCPAPSPAQGQVKIPFTAPGDTVEADFLKRDQGDKIARLTKVVEPAKTRIQAPCPHAGVCGGCLWQHMAYPAQLELKRDMINRAFTNAGHEEQLTYVHASPKTLHYRNRMDYVAGWKGELGLKEYGSWNHYLDLKTCLLLDDETPTILEATRSLTKELGWEPWDAKKHTGQFRYLVVRLGRNTQQRMLILVVKDLKQISETDQQKIREALGRYATSLIIGENPEITDLSYVKDMIALKGELFLEEEVNELRYKIHPNSFFQTNTDMAGVLQRHVLEQLGDLSHKKLLDLYCGLGFFGIAAAKAGASIHGHELDTNAIKLAHENAARNEVADSCTFSAGPTEDLSWAQKEADLIIVDPPRAGLHPKALKALIEKAAPTLVYVSCNYHSLVKELKELKSIYRIESFEAFDLFPQTPHVEVVVKLVSHS